MTANSLSISLAPSGAIWLHLPHHTVELPATVAGLRVLQMVLQEHTAQSAIGQNGNPTQHQIHEWLTSPEGQRALQLAGDIRRRKEIQQRTGVVVRPHRLERASPAPASLTLDELLA